MPGGVGTGSDGTCFSGGSGSGGSYYPDPALASTNNAGTRGGAGSAGTTVGLGPSQSPPYADGAGNPNGGATPGDPPDPQYDGTGGVLIVFVEGNINVVGGAKHFKANGAPGRQMTVPGAGPAGVYPFGGGTGGGIVIVINKDAATLTSNMEALGGIVAANGPSANFQSGGNGQAVAYTFGEL